MATVFLVAGLFILCLADALPAIRLPLATLAAIALFGWFVLLVEFLEKEKGDSHAT
jgi:hypothetical protein